MYNMKIHVAYIPDGKVIGLSKIPRIVDMVCKRLQLQERIGSDIADIIQMITGTKDVMVVIYAEHSCMTARGIKTNGTTTRTAVIRGLFDKNPSLRSEMYQLLKD
jgi:GTP cyclohydrolase I